MPITATSEPARGIAATPNGTRCSSSAGAGPRPRRAHRLASSKHSTGLSSRMAVLSRPLRSGPLLGTMIFSPGTFMNIG